MHSAVVVFQIVLVAGCIDALITLESLFFGLVVVRFFMGTIDIATFCPAHDHAESSCAS